MIYHCCHHKQSNTRRQTQAHQDIFQLYVPVYKPLIMQVPQPFHHIYGHLKPVTEKKKWLILPAVRKIVSHIKKNMKAVRHKQQEDGASHEKNIRGWT